MDKRILTHAIAAASGTAIGGTATYFVARKIWNKQLEQTFAEENERLEAYREEEERRAEERRNKTGAFATPEGALKKLIEEDHEGTSEAVERGRRIIQQLGYVPGDEVDNTTSTLDEIEVDVDTENESVTVKVTENKNVFATASDEDPGPEVAPDRWVTQYDPDKPYIISVQEFMEDHEDYDKLSITYYEGDDTLLDDAGQMINNVEETVREESLGKFGFGSGNPDMVYVRNEKFRTDFEVSRSEGSYTHDVLGIEEVEGHMVKVPKRKKVASHD